MTVLKRGKTSQVLGKKRGKQWEVCCTGKKEKTRIEGKRRETEHYKAGPNSGKQPTKVKQNRKIKPFLASNLLQKWVEFSFSLINCMQAHECMTWVPQAGILRRDVFPSSPQVTREKIWHPRNAFVRDWYDIACARLLGKSRKYNKQAKIRRARLGKGGGGGPFPPQVPRFCRITF